MPIMENLYMNIYNKEIMQQLVIYDEYKVMYMKACMNHKSLNILYDSIAFYQIYNTAYT